jgi:acetoin utilization deacetylase AcuC-like enzyme
MRETKLIYSEKYRVDIGAHVFPTEKYALIKKRLIKQGMFKEDDFLSPPMPDEKDVLSVHNEEYLNKLKKGKLSMIEILTMELPYSQELVEASLLCVGGTIQACKNAIENGLGIHIGGGFHHAFPDHGEGFCVLNDIACGIKYLQRTEKIVKALIVDCDLHQGNGTAYIFREDRSVFTFSIHQENNYPAIKPPSDLDIGLADGVSDEEYLEKLKENIPKIIDSFQPELVLFVAGADPYEKDQIGGLSLTMEGLKKRDELVIGWAKDANIPLCIVLAGGYAFEVNDTVTIHCNTIKTAINLFSNTGSIN